MIFIMVFFIGLLEITHYFPLIIEELLLGAHNFFNFQFSI